MSKADVIGVYAGLGSWHHASQGKLNHLGTDADLEGNYSFDKDWSGFFYVAVEHPFPLIPNIRISKYSLETSATKTVTADSEFTFAGTDYTNGTDISSKLQWNEEDILLYYELLDIVVSLDAGLGIKKVDGEISVTSAGVTNAHRIGKTIPIAYAMVGASIPGTGISVSMDTTRTFIGDSDIVQSNTKISYETAFLLGVEAGYRRSKMTLNNFDTVTGQANFTGPFVNLLFHF